jgi:phosphomannomutase
MSGQRRLALFGTDGVRGTANVYPMTAESLRRALGSV